MTGKSSKKKRIMKKAFMVWLLILQHLFSFCQPVNKDGDGHNDRLKAIPMGIREFKYFTIYNRWGTLVFQTSDPSKDWDGTLNGQLQPTGVFVWMAAGVDYQGALIQRKGTTILIR